MAKPRNPIGYNRRAWYHRVFGDVGGRIVAKLRDLGGLLPKRARDLAAENAHPDRLRDLGIEPADPSIEDVYDERQREQEIGWIPVIGSTNVAAFRYLPLAVELQVEFLDGSRYAYFNVPEDVYDAMFMVASKGHFVWSDLRDQYEYKLIRAGFGRRAGTPRRSRYERYFVPRGQAAPPRADERVPRAPVPPPPPLKGLKNIARKRGKKKKF